MGFYSRASMSSAPDEPPENIRLQRAFPFYRFLNRPVGRLYHQYQYSQNQMNDCLNWCISAFMLRVCCRAVSAQAILASLFARAQVTTKLLFRHNNSLTQSANLPDWCSSFCMNTCTLNGV
jgi:hypothetical protein